MTGGVHSHLPHNAEHCTSSSYMELYEPCTCICCTYTRTVLKASYVALDVDNQMSVQTVHSYKAHLGACLKTVNVNVDNMYTVHESCSSCSVHYIMCLNIYMYDRVSNYTNSYGFPGFNTDTQMQCSCILKLGQLIAS